MRVCEVGLLYIQIHWGCVIGMSKEEEEFRRKLKSCGCSQAAANELWKWYDSSKKKGVASY